MQKALIASCSALLVLAACQSPTPPPQKCETLLTTLTATLDGEGRADDGDTATNGGPVPYGPSPNVPLTSPRRTATDGTAIAKVLATSLPRGPTTLDGSVLHYTAAGQTTDPTSFARSSSTFAVTPTANLKCRLDFAATATVKLVAGSASHTLSAKVDTTAINPVTGKRDPITYFPTTFNFDVGGTGFAITQLGTPLGSLANGRTFNSNRPPAGTVIMPQVPFILSAGVSYNFEFFTITAAKAAPRSETNTGGISDIATTAIFDLVTVP